MHPRALLVSLACIVAYACAGGQPCKTPAAETRRQIARLHRAAVAFATNELGHTGELVIDGAIFEQTVGCTAAEVDLGAWEALNSRFTDEKERKYNERYRAVLDEHNSHSDKTEKLIAALRLLETTREELQREYDDLVHVLGGETRFRVAVSVAMFATVVLFNIKQALVRYMHSR
jgi:hypothetical protein